MKAISLFFAFVTLNIFASPSFAATPELDLACISDNFKVRGIIIGNNNTHEPLYESSGKMVTADKYAVVIERIYEENTEQWEILSDNEFSISSLGWNNYRFEDQRNNVGYDCQVNGVATAQPALTRTN